MVRHIVLYQPKPGVTPDDLGQLLRTLTDIPEVGELSCGTNSSPLGLAGQWAYGLYASFRDEPARRRYMTNPRHLAVGAAVDALIESLLVFGITTDEVVA
jgi:Stress responsive A/B Barrel Domain